LLANAMKILVADDDPTSRIIAEMVLRQLGHECHTVSDGIEAWDALWVPKTRPVVREWLMPPRGAS
jgi:CheY-like chemotaxis protein